MRHNSADFVLAYIAEKLSKYTQSDWDGVESNIKEQGLLDFILKHGTSNIVLHNPSFRKEEFVYL